MREKWQEIYTDVQLKRLQQILVDNLKVFIDVCNKLNIEYIVYGGTLLGTIKYNGLVPWEIFPKGEMDSKVRKETRDNKTNIIIKSKRIHKVVKDNKMDRIVKNNKKKMILDMIHIVYGIKQQKKEKKNNKSKQKIKNKNKNKQKRKKKRKRQKEKNKKKEKPKKNQNLLNKVKEKPLNRIKQKEESNYKN